MELKAAACTWPIFCLVSLLVTNPTASAVKCYVCGPGSLDAFHNDDHETTTTADSVKPVEVRPCNDFEGSSNKSDFERECPANLQGCITQIEGGIISRKCEDTKMSSCGQLRDATYCFCDSDLCNSKPITSPPTPIEPEISPYGDDEDYDEGEGSGQGHPGQLSPEQDEVQPKNIHIQTSSEPTSSIDIDPANNELPGPAVISANSVYSGSSIMHSHLIHIVFLLSALLFH